MIMIIVVMFFDGNDLETMFSTIVQNGVVIGGIGQQGVQDVGHDGVDHLRNMVGWQPDQTWLQDAALLGESEENRMMHVKLVQDVDGGRRRPRDNGEGKHLWEKSMEKDV